MARRSTGSKSPATTAAKPPTEEKVEKPSPKAGGYVVAAGRSLCATGRIIDAGEAITADDVADLEALVKGGYVVKA